ncbi:sulfotransferase 1C2-like [Mizuhopecten yessoensis]|uniref:sulfotransferase 1C2-like n=1 Tax=Mizuhopecten yessoensis TaxID=6573 RepID=UPI000B45A652|nr:sulfotransferase 1C2-like [Mizuhopecten yessoensis]
MAFKTNYPPRMTFEWFTYTKEWSQIIDSNQDLHIHMLYYEDLKSNPLGEVSRLAEFLKVEYDDQLIRDITDNCNFESLKQANKVVKATGNPNPEMEDFQNMYRKGEVGD